MSLVMYVCVLVGVVVNFGLDSFYLGALLFGIHVPSENVVRLTGLFCFVVYVFWYIFRLAVFAFACYYVKSIHVDSLKRCWELCASACVVYVGLPKHSHSR